MVGPSLILCYIIRNRINCGRSHELKLPPGYTLKKKKIVQKHLRYGLF